MKCPACIAAETKSILREEHIREPKKGGVVEKFWDEDGRKHVHDHTLHRMILSCSRGHNYQQKLKGRCPQGDCAWNQQPEVIAQSLPIGFAPLPASAPTPTPFAGPEPQGESNGKAAQESQADGQEQAAR